MAEESLTIPCETKTLEYHIVTLFEKLEELRRDRSVNGTENVVKRLPVQLEVRTLEFWRSIISECIASFFYVFIVCGAAAGAGVGASLSSVLLATALAAGFAMTTLTQCFGHISGAHVNPAVTLAMAVTRNISHVRAVLFLTAQCGGAIAGAALLYGVTAPGYAGNLSAVVAQSAGMAVWERFGIELILTFVVVFTYFVSMDTYRRWLGSSALIIGASYTACTFVSMPYLNPARSLGPSFVLNKWDNHWIYWFGPLVGGVLSGVIYEFVFNPRRHIRCSKDSIDGDSSSMHSDEDAYDDLDKPAAPKFHGSTYNAYRPGIIGTLPSSNNNPGNYFPSLTSASVYSATTSKLNRVESLYGGTKSLYCKSPALTRANLNRSQSVYAKSNCAINRDILPRPGPLVPAQSLYPMRLNQQQAHVQNQNVQNQIQQCSDGIYGVRGVASGTNRSESSYGTRSDLPGYVSNTAGRSDPRYCTAGSTSRTEPSYGTNSTTRSEPTYGMNARTDSSTYGQNNRSESGNSYNSGAYEARSSAVENTKYELKDETKKSTPGQGTRPESMYGMNQQRRGITEDSYHTSNHVNHCSNANPGRTATPGNANYVSSNSAMNYNSKVGNGQVSGFMPRSIGEPELRQSSPKQILSTTSNSSSSSYHHSRSQHSPNSQY